jgi:hypothetical protein
LNYLVQGGHCTDPSPSARIPRFYLLCHPLSGHLRFLAKEPSSFLGLMLYCVPGSSEVKISHLESFRARCFGCVSEVRLANSEWKALGMLWLADIALGGDTIIFFVPPYKNRGPVKSTALLSAFCNILSASAPMIR